VIHDKSLEEMVLGYCRQVGGLVEPPAYNIYEVLLPDDISTRWGIASHQQFVFNAEHLQENAVYLYYGHPLVETIVNELLLQSANIELFINNLRPEKPGLYSVIEKTISLPNAKMFAYTKEAEQVKLHHYLRFNFKVSLMADEKRELILPLWMDLQKGYPVNGADIERLALLASENQMEHTPIAAPSWIDEPAVSAQTFFALLERARDSITDGLGETLVHLQKRLARFLELDRDRLNEYYNDLLKDAQHRLQKADEDRRPVMEAKITAINAERDAKLADAEQKYHLRIQLELLNLAVVTLPKLDLTVEIRKRTTSVRRTVTWNPLLHIVEPLACDVCGRAGVSLMLCENGHLAHAECLALQCVDCKRTYCQKCAHEIQPCAVCQRPVCSYSQVHCPTCQQVTCQDHTNQCHGVTSQTAQQILSNKEKSVPAENGGITKASPSQVKTSPKQKPVQKRELAKTMNASPKVSSPKPLAKTIEVYADPAQGMVTAYAMANKREIAVRWWTFEESGIVIECQCEKGRNCQENGLIYRPMDDIDAQMKSQIGKFRVEYRVPEYKLRYFQIREGQPFEEKKLKVPSHWKDPEAIKKARDNFEKLRY
jgi:hypothetical protein